MPVTVTTDDITTLEVDVVVNAANEQLAHGGGVAAALVRAGGQVVQDESDAWVAEHGEVGAGRAATTSAGAMPADHVVHVVGPRWSGVASDRDALAAAVLAALDAAVEVGARSVALPAISAGVFGGPLDECTRIIAVTAGAWSGAREVAGPPGEESDDTDAEEPGTGADDPGAARVAADNAVEVVLVGFDEDVAAAFRAGLADRPANWVGDGPATRDLPA